MTLLNRFFANMDRNAVSVPSAAFRRRTPAVPSGFRIYAVGDVHGRLDLLDSLAKLIIRDLVDAPSRKSMTVFLGDYIDRGPHSNAVLERLIHGPWPTPMTALRGNHEDALLAFLEDPNFITVWKSVGGLETLSSYGVPVREVMSGRSDAGAAAHGARLLLQRLMPVEHLAFLKSLPCMATIGDYVFCHAGIRPGVALDEQSDQDLTTIRHAFLENNDDHGKVVVHGHTPSDEPQFLHNRIGIDTGAYATGRLTALVLDGTTQRVLQTGSR